MTKRRKPPMLLEACGVEQHAFRPRTIAFAGHGLLFRGDKAGGPVPCLAIGRDRDGEYVLLHCDGRWNVRGAMSGSATIRDVKARATGHGSGWLAAIISALLMIGHSLSSRTGDNHDACRPETMSRSRGICSAR